MLQEVHLIRQYHLIAATLTLSGESLTLTTPTGINSTEWVDLGRPPAQQDGHGSVLAWHATPTHAYYFVRSSFLFVLLLFCDYTVLDCFLCLLDGSNLKLSFCMALTIFSA